MAMLGCAILARADTIHLKNGHTIVADRVTEKNGRVYYEIGVNSYVIPKSLVESVESASEPPAPPPKPPAAKPKPAAPLPAPKKDLPVVVEGRVDTDALAAIEKAGNAQATAAALYTAGRHEYESGDRERARSYYERALRFAPDDANILSSYAAVLVQLGRAAEALPIAEHATRAAPNSADAFTVLGFAYYRSERTPDAVAAWRKAQQLRPDEALAAYIAKAERERKTEEKFSNTDAGHFSFRYEGDSTTPALREAVQTALEADYEDMVRTLGIAPHEPIAVSLYSDQAFFDVTQAPAWTGALNDGKLRIPVQGITAVTPELARVLRHELAHSFINQAARGRCPQWLNEGVAQLLEPRTLGPTRGANLAKLYAVRQNIPLNTLEISFLSFSPFEALVAYDESLAAAEYIRDSFGMQKVAEILTKIGEGSSTEMALRIVIHTGYAGLETQIGRYLTAKYGK
jgi:hypothetical protein